MVSVGLSVSPFRFVTCALCLLSVPQKFFPLAYFSGQPTLVLTCNSLDSFFCFVFHINRIPQHVLFVLGFFCKTVCETYCWVYFIYLHCCIIISKMLFKTKCLKSTSKMYICSGLLNLNIFLSLFPHDVTCQKCN